ncbi:DUF2207 domain-containing protein [Kangiella marina]|uniref:DUF2207 domain-containing protein n=1 Tax=Kangiella marina TaxID=1079178 RepID=A0ABP8IQJ4_9GAMM
MTKSLLASLILIIATLATFQASADERILEFHSDITIHQDSSLTVIETINIRSKGRLVRRGIYRDFPTTYQDRLGNTYQVGFDIQSITKDGRLAPWFTHNLRNGVRIYIGDKHQLLRDGLHTYTIAYKTSHQLGHFEEYDELYWNVTGNDWKLPINYATVTIHFPSDIWPSDVKHQGYTGYFGETGKSYRLVEHTKKMIKFETLSELKPAEGFTIGVGWPKGHVTVPTALERYQTLLGQNLHLIIFIAGLLVVLAYHIIVWLKVGKDPKSGVIIPIYDPPQKESPAAMRYILRNYYDHKTFTTALISLAVKGYLTIDEDKSEDKFIFTRTGKKVDFSAGEEAIADNLFANNAYQSTEEADNEVFVDALYAHKKSLEKDYKKKYFNLNASYLVIGILLSAASVFLGVIFKDPFANIALPAIIVIGLHLAINFIFGLFIKAPTVVGRKFMDKAEGLKHYLTIAETDQLRQQYPLTKTPSNFERYLPYAFALDIEETWADYFGDRLQNQFIQQDGPAMSKPTWFNATNNHIGINTMTSQLSTQVLSSVVASATPPGSTSGSGFSSGGGFGGGGFSGGGGGGGGGGGW